VQSIDRAERNGGAGDAPVTTLVADALCPVAIVVVALITRRQK
jgi:hypothetical protein